jgi:dihydroorotate dehydrogenase electron transfer subunit
MPAVIQPSRHRNPGFPADPTVGSGPIHALHPRGASLPPASVADLIRAYTREGDVVLDPFGGNGTTAIEALRLGRRAVTIDPNPLASFFTEVVFTPASLPRLQWAFQDLRDACRGVISELFATACPGCGKKGVVHFLRRENGKLVRLDYSCACNPGMRSKKPDAGDRRMEVENPTADIPFWYPTRLPLPAEKNDPLEYPADFLRRRTVAALSVLLNSINNITEPSVRDVMKLAFALGLPACHCPAPFPARESGARGIPPGGEPLLGRRGPQRCTVSNPWDSFAECFRKVYEAKKAGNTVLGGATIGYGYGELESRQANVVILGKSAEDALICELPERSADYVFSEPPLGRSEIGFFPAAIQAAWLRMEFDYNREIVLAPEYGRSLESYRERMHVVLRGLRRVAKEGSTAHLFCGDARGADFQGFLNLLEAGGLGADQIRYQAADRRGPQAGKHPADGGYLVRIPLVQKQNRPAGSVPAETLHQKAADAARDLFVLYGGKITPDKILHVFYQRLEQDEIASLPGSPPDELLAQAVSPFARFRNGKLTFLKGRGKSAGSRRIPVSWRRIALDAEALAAGDPRDGPAARELAIRRLAREGLTAEDASVIRQSLRPAEIRLHRRKRTASLLREWGTALGHTTRIPANRPELVFWKLSGGRKVGFTLGPKEIRIASQLKDGTVSEWGALSYLDLERRLGEWCRNHPAAGTDLLGRCAPFNDFLSPEPPAPQGKTSPVKDWSLKVIQNRKILAGHFLIELELPKGAPLDFLPGQFFHVLCDADGGKADAYPLTLRRPLSIHRAEYPGFHRAALAQAEDLPEEILQSAVRRPARIDFLYRVVGRGTESLSRARKGAAVHAIGPCGNGFSIGAARTAVIVAGGIGIAPLAALAERLRLRGKEVLIYLGAVSKEMLGLAVGRPDGADPGDGIRADQRLYDAIHSEFEQIGAKLLTVCTDDGSLGEKGLVTEMLAAGIRDGCVPRESVRLYACGPEGMLRAVAEIAARYSLDCQVSLERRMACAVGACYSCTTRVIGPDGKVRRKRVCREGPVFEARDIQWKD